MFDEEWLARAHPLELADYVLDRASDRRRRLFTAACCRALGEPAAAQACERVADGLADVSVLGQLPGAAPPRHRRRNTWSSNPLRISRGAQVSQVLWAAGLPSAEAAARTVAEFAFPQLQRQLIDLILEFVGNPFRPHKAEPAWVEADGGIVARLARAVHEGGTYEDLPVLADLLEEAGCRDADLLSHCRREGGHSRGCWAVDLLLGQD
jgi:hypothetical protein